MVFPETTELLLFLKCLFLVVIKFIEHLLDYLLLFEEFLLEIFFSELIVRDLDSVFVDQLDLVFQRLL